MILLLPAPGRPARLMHMSAAYRLDDQMTDYEASAAEMREAMPDSGTGAFETWRAKQRERLADLLGVELPSRGLAPSAMIEHERERDGIVERKWRLEEPGRAPVPAYELVPQPERETKRALLVLHGHNPNVQYCLGNYPDEATAARMRAKDNNYAESPARLGYRVFAIEQQGFGERQSRQEPHPHDDNLSISCRDLALRCIATGRTIQGERVRDTYAVLRWLQARGFEEFAITGNSGGGTTLLWAAALSDEIGVVIPGSAFSSFRASIYGVYHCDCNYVPGVLQVTEAGELAALIAPRPLCFVQGEKDPLFPAGTAREQFETVRRAYRVFGAEDRCQLEFHPGEHAYNHAVAQRFLTKHFPDRH